MAVPSVTEKVQVRTRKISLQLTGPVVTFKSSGRSWEPLAGCSEVKSEGAEVLRQDV